MPGSGRTGSPIERAHYLKVTEKANVIYETVGKLAGMNVLFDPDYTRSKSTSN